MISGTLRHLTTVCRSRNYAIGRRYYNAEYKNRFVQFIIDLNNSSSNLFKKLQRIEKFVARRAYPFSDEQQISNTAQFWGGKGMSVPVYRVEEGSIQMPSNDQQQLMELALIACNSDSTPLAIRELGGWNGISIFYIYSKLPSDCRVTASMLDINPAGVRTANDVSRYLRAPFFKAFYGNGVKSMPPINPDVPVERQLILASRFISILSEGEIDEMMHNISQQLGNLPGMACLSFPIVEAKKGIPESYRGHLSSGMLKQITFANGLGFSVVADQNLVQGTDELKPGGVFQTFVYAEKVNAFFEQYNLTLIYSTSVETELGFRMGIVLVGKK